jgi:hypothetical protein
MALESKEWVLISLEIPPLANARGTAFLMDDFERTTQFGAIPSPAKFDLVSS